MLNFNEKQVTINIFIPITLIFILFMPNYRYRYMSKLRFFLHFSSFWTSWIRIRIPNADPDPGDLLNADPSGSGSETLGGSYFWYFVRMSL
jgi:hypothetical protein